MNKTGLSDFCIKNFSLSHPQKEVLKATNCCDASSFCEEVVRRSQSEILSLRAKNTTCSPYSACHFPHILRSG